MFAAVGFGSAPASVVVVDMDEGRTGQPWRARLACTISWTSASASDSCFA
jgi:hypothetical protein